MTWRNPSTSGSSIQQEHGQSRERRAWIAKLGFKAQVIKRSAPTAPSLDYSGPDLVDLNTEDPELGSSFGTASSLVEITGLGC